MVWWKFWVKKKFYPHEKIERQKVDTDKIKVRLTSLGWTIKELPIRQKHVEDKSHEITSWKLIAIRGEKSFDISGKTLDEAFNTLGQSLGVIPRKMKNEKAS